MADGGAVAGGVIGAIVFIGIVVLILRSTIYIVQQAESISIERFGRFDRILAPGWHCVVPCVEAPRNFSWRRTSINQGQLRDEIINDYRVDLRESVFNFLPQEVYTRDTVMLQVNCVMYYSIQDVRKAIYEVEDLTTAVSNTAQTQLKEVFGGMTFQEALCSQESINLHMKRNFGATFEGWGLKVHRIELQDMTPKGATSMSMKAQMIAERRRRAEFIRAEGNKAAVRLVSEGEKMARINMGVATQEATRKRSEGSAQAQVEVARAEKAALDAVADAIVADNCSQTEYMIGQRYNQLLQQVASASASGTRFIYLPYEASHIGGVVSSLPKVYGRDAPRIAGGGGSAAPVGSTAAPRDEFDDLS
ncbi:qmcA [Symbiodinium sp. KB8]|nr:qmcA [Symbiodinium sp. KB8]